MVEVLQDLAEEERDQRILLSQSSLSEHGWLGFSSTSQLPSAQTSGHVTIAGMPVPTVHIRSRTTAA